MHKEIPARKEVGFIRSFSSKGLKKPKAYYQSDSQSFSSFQCNNQRTNKNQRQYDQFSPYKQPQNENTWHNNNIKHFKNDSMKKSNGEINKMKIKYPPKSNYLNSDNKMHKQPSYIKDFTQQFKNYNRFNKSNSAERNKSNKIHTCGQEYFKPVQKIKKEYQYQQQQQQELKQKKDRVTFSNQKLRLQCNYNTFHPNNHQKENNQKILHEVNKICQRISQIKLDFQFNQSGNILKKDDQCNLPLKLNNHNSYNNSQKESQRVIRRRRQENQIQRQNQQQKKIHHKNYQQFTHSKQFKQPVVYEDEDSSNQQFSLGGYSNRNNYQKQLQISPIANKQSQKRLNNLQNQFCQTNQIEKKQNFKILQKELPLKGCQNVQHRLLAKNRVSSLEDQSSIEQCLQQDYKQLFTKGQNPNEGKFYNPNNLENHINPSKKNQQFNNGLKNSGVFKTTSQYINNRIDYQENKSNDNLDQGDLIQQYKTSQFKNKGLKQQILQNSRRKNHHLVYSSSNSKSNSKKDLRQHYQVLQQKMEQQEGFFESKGGVCFGIDTRQFKCIQKNNYNQNYYDDGQYLKNKNKYPTYNPVMKKVKKVDPKQQILKRRQMAKNYDQMARRKVFGNS